MSLPVRTLLFGALSLAWAPGVACGGYMGRLNASLAGHVLDFTNDNGADRRISSAALGLKRDLFVYLPPGYDPDKSYPLLVWLHGFGGDEDQFINQVVRALDRAIACGEMPPVIAAAPDASLPSRWPWCPGSWYINSSRGSWEDYIIHDLVPFLEQHFKIRPERQARIIGGWSMGGFGAYNLGMKHPDRFGILVGVYPNLNLRYADRDGHWGSDFDPETVGWLSDMKWRYMLGCYPRYRFPVPAGAVFLPVWGRGSAAIARMSQENPREMLDRLDIQDGQFDMFIAYGRKDEYNVDAQVDSFLYRARQRGLNIWVRLDPDGHHSAKYVTECMPELLRAVGSCLRERLAGVEPTVSRKDVLRH